MKDYSIKLSILKALSEGDFVSGETLGQTLGVSRAAVSKHIKGIQEWGVDIFRVQGKGYQLSQPIDLLDANKIECQSPCRVYLHPIIDSTNQYLLDRVGELKSGDVCVAEYQAKGRGRRGRQWLSPFGSNLYFSMYWCLEAGMGAAMGLSLVIGVAVVDALEGLGVKGVKLKWPNDLYYQDKKLAGILVEMSGQAGGAAHLVMGMGMNLNMRNTDIDQPWVALAQIPEVQAIDRNLLTSAFIDAWYKTLMEYEQTGMHNFVERWNRMDNFLGRPIKLIMGSNEIKGICRGINEQGAVLIETEQGLQSYIGGEISLRSNE